MADFLVIGECVADIVRVPGAPEVAHPGGSPANVAYGLARLGGRVTLLTQLGADPAGELITARLRAAGVELLTDGQQGVRTPSAVVTLDPQGRAAYDFDIAWTLRQVEPPTGVRHVHVGSIGAIAEPGARTVLAVTAGLRPDATVSYDPNIRPALLGEREQAVARVERCVTLADLVKASDEDLAWLYPGEPVRAVAERWLALGPAAVLVTLGGDGALAYTPEREVTATAVVVREVADTVGAGDAFMSAALDALDGLGLLGAGGRPALTGPGLSEERLAAVLRRACTAASLTVSRPGANPPDSAELRAALN